MEIAQMIANYNYRGHFRIFADNDLVYRNLSQKDSQANLGTTLVDV
jgi:hypothetical protein